MITILILRKAAKLKMENKLLRGGIIALDKISKQLPAHTGHLAIVNGERFLGLLIFTLDERAPEYTSAEDCCGRAGELRGTYLSKLQDRLKKIGTWPISRK
ncbi:hypothetical protein HYPSUDRAFT_209958 [Hypholoma sublateritium FD-334 SS-4]|uniref:Uncharacterized protein n=1 Tax=Hypholoma sublateritium (strain FD-334 SS-4) TaxID=945553 RepID=A0A0D2N180_HYPSF|nr:hypothetical protein HYPSUDRAFT_209958 [Hypholoma sublateritium FD-334 SS-4]